MILEIERIKTELKLHEVNHLLHLVLTLITMGLWVVVWVIVTLTSSAKINDLRHDLAALRVGQKVS